MTQSVTLNVSGMKCGGCENNVKGKLSELNGIVNVDAIHKDDIVKVEYDNSKISLNDIKQTISDAGFSVED